MTLQEQAQALRTLWNSFVAEKEQCPEAYEFLVEYHISRAMNGEPPWPYYFIVGAVENHREALALGQHFQGGRTTLPIFVKKMQGGDFNYMPGNFKIENFDKRTFNKEAESVAEKHARTLENGL